MAVSFDRHRNHCCVGNTDKLVLYISTHTAYLGESSDSVLIGEEWRVIPNLKVKVNCLVCEGGELVAETELEGAVLGCCEGKAVILLLHLLVESCSIWVLQTTVHIIMATGHNLEKYRQEDHQYSCTERKIYSIPRSNSCYKTHLIIFKKNKFQVFNILRCKRF